MMKVAEDKCWARCRQFRHVRQAVICYKVRLHIVNKESFINIIEIPWRHLPFRARKNTNFFLRGNIIAQPGGCRYLNLEFVIIAVRQVSFRGYKIFASLKQKSGGKQ